MFSLFEVFISTLLYWIPFYYAFKASSWIERVEIMSICVGVDDQSETRILRSPPICMPTQPHPTPPQVAFLLWCMHPTWRGAEFIYVHFLKDVFVRVDGNEE